MFGLISGGLALASAVGGAIANESGLIFFYVGLSKYSLFNIKSLFLGEKVDNGFG